MPEQMSEGWESLRDLAQEPDEDLLLGKLGAIYAKAVEKQRKAHPLRKPGDPTEVEFLTARARGFTEDERQRWAVSRFCALLLKLHWRSESPSPELLDRFAGGRLTGFERVAMMEHLQEPEGRQSSMFLAWITDERAKQLELTRETLALSMRAVDDALKAQDEARKENIALENRATEAVGRIGLPGVEALVTAVADTNAKWQVRAIAAGVLGWIGGPEPKDEKAIGVWVQAVTGIGGDLGGPEPEDEWTRDLWLRPEARFLRYLPAHPPTPAPRRYLPVRAIEALVAALGDTQRQVRAVSAAALEWIGPGAEPAIEALVAALADKNDYVRRSAARVLGQIGPGAEPAVGALGVALTDATNSVRESAAEALERIGPGAEPAVGALITALGDANDRVRYFAGRALERIGAAAVGRLRAALTHENPAVRNRAAMVLAVLDPGPTA